MAKYQVLPLDDRRAERFEAGLAGRPELITGTAQMLYPAMQRLGENAVLNLKNQSYSVTAEVVRWLKVRRQGDHPARVETVGVRLVPGRCPLVPLSLPRT